ncbi:hypothetical protein ACMHYB_30490 [Sorangium sp. So ce1128]
MPLVRLAQVAFRAESVLPAALESAGDESILGLDALVRARGALRLVPCPFESLLPESLLLGALLLEIGADPKTDLQRGRSQRRERQRCNSLIDAAT